MEPLSILTESEILHDNKSIFDSFKHGDFRAVLDSDQAAQIFYGRLSDDKCSSNLNRPSPERRTFYTIESSPTLDHAPDLSESLSQQLFIVALAALYAFLQANVTGPPLGWHFIEAHVTTPKEATSLEPNDRLEIIKNIRQELIASLSQDGISAYPLAPRIELLWLANSVLHDARLDDLGLPVCWARLRVKFWHQMVLTEESPSLRETIYREVELLDQLMLETSTLSQEARTCYLLERAAVDIFHGLDTKAREDLDGAAKNQHFEYVLTGRLGKRTKFQQNDLSQLVVLAKSAETQGQSDGTESSSISNNDSAVPSKPPRALDLNDDTLLESISFQKQDRGISEDGQELPSSLSGLDPTSQPLLNPLDSIILLSLTSSITNTSPQHGLTREETLPYVTRVLDGGSSNWQIYTQALLARSRIEGYRSRTVERSVLQLQALVDQVIAATSDSALHNDSQEPNGNGATTFLPRAQESESAPATERLRYIHQLATPFRWSLEAELASKWVSIGGLQTAVEIYERLEMWAEVALCWAATGKEEKARDILRWQLRLPDHAPEEGSNFERLEATDLRIDQSRLPADAPRLFCILGDLESSPAYYELAWKASDGRYARAMRSLGKHYVTKGRLEDADSAYAMSLKLNPQNASAWFSLGCVRLALEEWKGSVDAFTRTIQIEPEDAEAWSNLGAALIRLPGKQSSDTLPADLENGHEKPRVDPQELAKEALVAFKRAAALKRDSYRVWQNILNVAVTIAPPPYADIIVAQKRLIELRGATDREDCIDVEAMEGILRHIIASKPQTSTAYDESVVSSEVEKSVRKHGLERVFVELAIKDIKPLITHSRRLWQFIARLHLHLNQPSSALEAYEKAWRATMNIPGWDDGMVSASAKNRNDGDAASTWQAVVDATVELVDAYESLGEREVTEGLGAGKGQLVCKNWRFKARMAIKSVLGRRAKAELDQTEVLEERLRDLVSD